MRDTSGQPEVTTPDVRRTGSPSWRGIVPCQHLSRHGTWPTSTTCLSGGAEGCLLQHRPASKIHIGKHPPIRCRERPRQLLRKEQPRPSGQLASDRAHKRLGRKHTVAEAVGGPNRRVEHRTDLVGYRFHARPHRRLTLGRLHPRISRTLLEHCVPALAGQCVGSKSGRRHQIAAHASRTALRTSPERRWRGTSRERKCSEKALM